MTKIYEGIGTRLDYELRAGAYLDLLQTAVDLFDAELELCNEVGSDAWIWLSQVQYAFQELERADKCSNH